MRTFACLGVLFLVHALAQAGDAGFAAPPVALKSGEKTTITFSLSKNTDVEVAVLDAKGGVARHLAAGGIGGKLPPPEPLKAGLSQTLDWDGKDDLGKTATGGPFKVRIRTGLQVKLANFIGEDPYIFGSINSIATDEEGNLYAMAHIGGANQN